MGDRTYKIGVIGLGSMGSRYMKHLAASDRWDVVAACDLSAERLEWARETYSGIETTKSSADIITRADLDAVGIFTLADGRPQLIE
ncbi:MAG: Gfo/Idh/MocA family oxidoreductase, partial [Kiritimatiellae bacterium]|nr:Gfo/Idh/MocA family oxidoreductase [Kiritimatiellia bacterium]